MVYIFCFIVFLIVIYYVWYTNDRKKLFIFLEIFYIKNDDFLEDQESFYFGANAIKKQNLVLEKIKNIPHWYFSQINTWEDFTKLCNEYVRLLEKRNGKTFISEISKSKIPYIPNIEIKF